MSLPEIKHCPGTLAEGFNTYSRTCLKRVFMGKAVNHVLPYDSPGSDTDTNELKKASVMTERNSRGMLAKQGEFGGKYVLLLRVVLEASKCKE